MNSTRVNILLLLLLLPLSLCFSQKLIDEEILIPTNDTKLFANIRGSDSTAPIILYLHDGPCSPLGVPFLKAYAGPQLEKDFIMVYLHQRGIMKSLRVPDSTHTISNYVDDVFYVVKYLKKRFNGRDIVLFGHSWGGVLSYLFILKHDDEVQKMVITCSPTNVEEMTYRSIEMLLDWAEETENQEARDEILPLEYISFKENPEDFEIMGKWLRRAYGGWHRNMSTEKVYSVIDYESNFPAWFNEQKKYEKILRPEILQINLSDSLLQLKTPLLCIAGKEDVDVPWKMIKNDYEKYGGEKSFVLFENSHHMVFIDEEERFVEVVRSFLSGK